MLISSISPMNSTKTVTDTFTGSPAAKQTDIINFVFCYNIDRLHVWLIGSLAHWLIDSLTKTMEEVIERLSNCCSTYFDSSEWLWLIEWINQTRKQTCKIHAQSEETNSSASGTGGPEVLFSCSCQPFSTVILNASILPYCSFPCN